MRLLKGSLTCLVKEGRLTLQIPDLVIDVQGYSNTKPLEFIDYPDDWFITLHDSWCGYPAIGKQSGFLYLSRKGYEANKKILKNAWSNVRGSSWSDFEAHAEEHFKKVEKGIAKKIKKLKADLAELKKIVP